MAGRTKKPRPRKRYTMIGNPIANINRLNTRFTTEEHEEATKRAVEAVAAFRTGTSTYSNWLHLCTALNVSRAVERQGVIVGFTPYLDRAYDVLENLGGRFDKSPDESGRIWEPTALRYDELGALDDLLYAYKFIMRELTFAEYQRAFDLAIARVVTAGGRRIDNRHLALCTGEPARERSPAS